MYWYIYNGVSQTWCTKFSKINQSNNASLYYDMIIMIISFNQQTSWALYDGCSCLHTSIVVTRNKFSSARLRLVTVSWSVIGIVDTGCQLTTGRCTVRAVVRICFDGCDDAADKWPCKRFYILYIPSMHHRTQHQDHVLAKLTFLHMLYIFINNMEQLTHVVCYHRLEYRSRCYAAPSALKLKSTVTPSLARSMEIIQCCL